MSRNQGSAVANAPANPNVGPSVAEKSLHTAYKRDDKWFVAGPDGKEIELSPEQSEKAISLKAEAAERDRQTTARAKAGVRVLHLGFITKTDDDKDTKLYVLCRSILQNVFKGEVKGQLKDLDKASKSTVPILQLVTAKMADGADVLAESISAILNEQLHALHDACEPGVMCNGNVNAAEIVRNFLNWSPSTAIKNADMAFASKV